MSGRYTFEDDLGDHDRPRHYANAATRYYDHDQPWTGSLRSLESDGRILEKGAGNAEESSTKTKLTAPDISWGLEGYMAPRLSYKDRTFEVLTRPPPPPVDAPSGDHQTSKPLGSPVSTQTPNPGFGPASSLCVITPERSLVLRPCHASKPDAALWGQELQAYYCGVDVARPSTADSSVWNQLQDDTSQPLLQVKSALRNFSSAEESRLWDEFTKDVAISSEDVLRAAHFEDVTEVPAYLFESPRSSRSSSPQRSRTPSPASHFSATPVVFQPSTSRSRSRSPALPAITAPPAPSSAPTASASSTDRRVRRRSPKSRSRTPSRRIIEMPDPFFESASPSASPSTATAAVTSAPAPGASGGVTITASPSNASVESTCQENASSDSITMPELRGTVVNGPRPHHLFIPSWVYTARNRDEEVFDNSIYYYFEHNRWPNYIELPERFQMECVRTNTPPDAYNKNADGFAPVWLFVLNHMGEEKPKYRKWFAGCISGFFDNGAFPPMYMLPEELESMCAHLGIDEDDFYEEEGFDSDP